MTNLADYTQTGCHIMRQLLTPQSIIYTSSIFQKNWNCDPKNKHATWWPKFSHLHFNSFHNQNHHHSNLHKNHTEKTKCIVNFTSTAVWTRIPIGRKKECGELLSNKTYFPDIYFSGVETLDKVVSQGVYYSGLVDTSHTGFCIAILEKLMR